MPQGTDILSRTRDGNSPVGLYATGWPLRAVPRNQ